VTDREVLAITPPDEPKGHDVQLDQLIAELLARGDINDDTTIELNRILNDWREGKLDPGDADYVTALHAKVMNLMPDAEAPSQGVGPDRLDGLDIEEWRERALRAEARLADLEDAARNP
jgi:hypothetical protein